MTKTAAPEARGESSAPGQTSHHAEPLERRARQSTPPFLRGMRAAFVFLTRLPVGGFPYATADWRWAPAHFPFVGLVVGSLGAAVLWGAAPLGSFLAATLTVVALVLATGAFHEDGLADTADALGGAHGPKKIHEILKDSRIGTYGAVALALSLLLRVGALTELGLAGVLPLVLIHAAARTGPVWLMALLPYVSGEGAKGSSVAKGGGLPQSLVASLWTLGGFGICNAVGIGLPLLVATAVATVVVTMLLASWFRARAGGITGDFLGATQQVTEVVLLLVCVAMTRLGT